MLKNVKLTGVVTLFYSEICSQLGIIDTKDKQRTQLYNYFKNTFTEKKKNVHNLLSIEKLDFQGIINVGYRNYIFDTELNRIIKETGAREIINLGCGMDTRYNRLKEYHGEYYDVDFKSVINEKRKLIHETEEYHCVETKSVTSKDFWEKELILNTNNPIFLAEGLFCYIEYENVINFVKELFDRYPEATLICDVFLYEKHQCFNDKKSKMLLKFPIHGEKIYKYFAIFEKKRDTTEVYIDGKKELKGINLVSCRNSSDEHIKVIYNGAERFPQFWIGTYRRG